MRYKLKEIIQKQGNRSFVEGSLWTEEEALGIVISHYFEWDGLKILKTLSYALEDANFHSENEIINGIIEKLEAK
jgi:hypothetical protein